MVRSERGFSLIELLLVIALLAIIGTMFTGTSTSSKKRAALEQSINDVVALIRTARQNSTAVRAHPTLPSSYPSYGVHFDTAVPNKILLYADCVPDDNASGAISFDDSFGFNANNCGVGRGTIEEMTLQGGVEITDVEAMLGTGNSWEAKESFSVLFIRPEPTIWFSSNTGSEEAGTIRVTLSSVGSGDSIALTLNSSGLVELEQMN